MLQVLPSAVGHDLGLRLLLLTLTGTESGGTFVSPNLLPTGRSCSGWKS